MILSRGTLHRTFPVVARTVTNVLPLAGEGGGELGGLSVSIALLGISPASGRTVGSFCFGQFIQLKAYPSLLQDCGHSLSIWRPLVMSLLAELSYVDCLTCSCSPSIVDLNLYS